MSKIDPRYIDTSFTLLTDVSDSVSWDMLDSGTHVRFVQDGNYTLENPTNTDTYAGQTCVVYAEQDATGGRSLTFASNFKFPNGTPTHNTSADAITVYPFVERGGNFYHMGDTGGGVTKTGTPADNQIAIWTDANTIEGDATLAWNGNELGVGTAPESAFVAKFKDGSFCQIRIDATGSNDASTVFSQDGTQVAKIGWDESSNLAKFNTNVSFSSTQFGLSTSADIVVGTATIPTNGGSTITLADTGTAPTPGVSTATLYSDTIGGHVQPAAVTEHGVRRSVIAFDPEHIDGFAGSLATDTNHDISIAAGTCRDSTDVVNIELSSALIKQIDAVFAAGNNAGGLFSGSVAASTVYYIHLIYKDSDGSVDWGYDTSSTAANIPTGYTYYRNIGELVTDSSSDIEEFTIYHNRSLLLTTVNKTADYTLKAGERAVFDLSGATADVTATLPSAPLVGDVCEIVLEQAHGTHALDLGSNLEVMGSSTLTKWVLFDDADILRLRYTNATVGWEIDHSYIYWHQRRTVTETSSFTVTRKHLNAVVECDSSSAITVIIPPASTLPTTVQDEVTVVQWGTGETSIAGGTGVTTNNANGLKCNKQYSAIFSKRMNTTNQWVVGGDAKT